MAGLVLFDHHTHIQAGRRFCLKALSLAASLFCLFASANGLAKDDFFVEQAPLQAEFIQEQSATSQVGKDCVVGVAGAQGRLLTVEEQIAILDQNLDLSLLQSNDCLTDKQNSSAAAGYGGGGGGQGQGSGQVGSSGSGFEEGMVAGDGNADGHSGGEGPTAMNNGADDQGQVYTDADEEVCRELRKNHQSASGVSKTEIAQAAKEFGCSGF